MLQFLICCLSCRNQGQENASAERIAELERQLAEARTAKDSEMNDENSRIVSMLAEVSACFLRLPGNDKHHFCISI